MGRKRKRVQKEERAAETNKNSANKKYSCKSCDLFFGSASLKKLHVCMLDIAATPRTKKTRSSSVFKAEVEATSTGEETRSAVLSPDGGNKAGVSIETEDEKKSLDFDRNSNEFGSLPFKTVEDEGKIPFGSPLNLRLESDDEDEEMAGDEANDECETSKESEEAFDRLYEQAEGKGKVSKRRSQRRINKFILEDDDVLMGHEMLGFYSDNDDDEDDHEVSFNFKAKGRN